METPNQTAQLLEDIVKTITSMSGGGLTILVCLVVGYVVKKSRRINNNSIPVIVVLTGAICYPFVSSPGNQPPDMGNPIVRQVALGLVLGLVSWLIHLSVLKRFLDSKIFKDDDTKPPFPTNKKGEEP